MKGDERGLHGWRWMKADVNGWKWIKWMKVNENIRRATCMHDSLMPLLMILISMTMMKFTVSFHKSWVVSFPCGKLCPNQRWPSCRSPECCFAHNSQSSSINHQNQHHCCHHCHCHRRIHLNPSSWCCKCFCAVAVWTLPPIHALWTAPAQMLVQLGL